MQCVGDFDAHLERVAVLRDDVQAALRGADTMRDALEEALQIRLLEAKELPIARAPVDLRSLIGEAASTVEPTARRKRITLSTACISNEC